MCDRPYVAFSDEEFEEVIAGDRKATTNRQLTDEEREMAKGILADVRERISQATHGDQDFAFALRRYIYARLIYDERGNSTDRKKLKFRKMAEQEAKCAECGKKLPEKGSVLDRRDAMKSYNDENTRLLCHDCDRTAQAEKGF